MGNRMSLCSVLAGGSGDAGGGGNRRGEGVTMPACRKTGSRAEDYRVNSRSAWFELLTRWDEMVERAGWIKGYSVLGLEMLDRVLRNRRTFDAITRRKNLLARLKGLSTEQKLAEMQRQKDRLTAQRDAVGAGRGSALQRAIDDLSVSMRQVKYFAEYGNTRNRAK